MWWNCALHGHEGGFRKPHNLSSKKAEEFSENVRKNFEHGDLNFRVKFKLYNPKKSDNKKFGETFYTNSSEKQAFKVTLEGKEYDFSHRQDQVEKTFIGENLQANVPFFDDLVLAPQDLYLFLNLSLDDSYEYFGSAKVAGRPVQRFIRHEENSIDNIQYSNVMVSIDAKYMIILQIDFLNDILVPVRQLSIRSFKDFGGSWMPKIIEITDFQNHRHAKLEILSVETET
ncbi:MAG: outer membrane lipoprotein-sorting protein [Puniceicoccales bacterium]|nr:outer membrane lipoprotein-sorting protein [Puniceicoccales bacterium]